MEEFMPILSGLVVGGMLGVVRPSTRLPLGMAAAMVLGTFATIVSGEFRLSWAFLLVDIPLVAVSAGATLMVVQRVRAAIGGSRGSAA